MFESFGSFMAVFSLMTFIAIVGLVFQKQIDELEDKFDNYIANKKINRR